MDSPQQHHRRRRSDTYSSGAPRSSYRILLATPGIRVFLIWVILFFSAVSYGYANFYRDPGSVFFDPGRAYERWYSLWRGRQAEEFISSAAKKIEKAGTAGFMRAGEHPKICASFLTVKRNLEKQYVDTSIGSLLQGLTPTERADMNLKVFFANADPSNHPTWTQPWLRPLVDEAYSYPEAMTPNVLEYMRSLEAKGREGILEKGVTDYTIALRHCYDNTDSPYIAVFEDDILLADGWLVRSLLGLKEVERQMGKQKRPGQWLNMRLFNQERSIGWSSKRIGGNHEHWIFLAIDAVVGAILVGFRRRSRVVRAHLDNWALVVICCLAIPSFVVLFFQSGKASLLPPAPGVKQEPFGCCSQGMIFSREQVPGLVEYLQRWSAERPPMPTFLRQQEVGKYDMMTRDYSRVTGLARWSLYPVQIQHLGIRSTIDTKESEAQAVWSMAYESLNPKTLTKTHAAMIKEFYGTDVGIAS